MAKGIYRVSMFNFTFYKECIFNKWKWNQGYSFELTYKTLVNIRFSLLTYSFFYPGWYNCSLNYIQSVNSFLSSVCLENSGILKGKDSSRRALENVSVVGKHRWKAGMRTLLIHSATWKPAALLQLFVLERISLRGTPAYHGWTVTRLTVRDICFLFMCVHRSKLVRNFNG